MSNYNESTKAKYRNPARKECARRYKARKAGKLEEVELLPIDQAMKALR